jgi:hypothetical protein
VTIEKRGEHNIKNRQRTEMGAMGRDDTSLKHGWRQVWEEDNEFRFVHLGLRPLGQSSELT